MALRQDHGERPEAPATTTCTSSLAAELPQELFEHHCCEVPALGFDGSRTKSGNPTTTLTEKGVETTCLGAPELDDVKHICQQLHTKFGEEVPRRLS